jgi:hypothetical protein
MAQMLYLPDGSSEVVLGDPEETLHRIVYERLGRDCAELLEEVIEEAECYPEGDDYERIADGQLSLLQTTLEELDATLTLFDSPRLNKAKLQKQLQAIRDNLYKNL